MLGSVVERLSVVSVVVAVEVLQQDCSSRETVAMGTVVVEERPHLSLLIIAVILDT